MLRITCAATVLLLCASDVRAQYQTRFDVDAGWTFTSNHPTFGWDVDDDPADRFHSPLASLNVQYAEGHWVSATATSPAIDISGMTHPELSFWTWADVTEDICVMDLRTLRIVQDGGPALFDYCLSQRSPSGPDYEEYRLPLDPAWGTIRVVFDFNSVDGFANVGQGWFVDDLRVAEAGCPAPLYYCFVGNFWTGKPGSLIHAHGSTSIAANDLQLEATHAAPGQAAIFFFGDDPSVMTPLGDGYLCVGGTLQRLPPVSTGSGSPTFDVDYGIPPASGITVGSTWYFQCW